MNERDLQRMILDFLKDVGQNSSTTSVILHNKKVPYRGGSRGGNDEDGQETLDEENFDGRNKNKKVIKLKMFEVEGQDNIVVYVHTLLSKNQLNLTLYENNGGFLITENRHSKDAVQGRYSCKRGYSYKDHTFFRGVLKVRFSRNDSNYYNIADRIFF